MSYKKLIKIFIAINLILLSIILFNKIAWIHQLLKVIFKAFIIPVIIALFLFYIMKPLNDIFLKKNIKPSLCAFLNIVIALFIAVGVGVLFSKYIVAEIYNMGKYLNNLSENAQSINGLLEDLNNYINLDYIYKEFAEVIKNYLRSAAPKIIYGFTHIANIFSDILLILIILFYMLKDGSIFKSKILNSIPEKYKRLMDKTLSQSNDILSLYITGQAKVALSLSIMIFIGYKAIGMPSAILFSSMTFILAFIPFIGFFISMILPYIIAMSFGLNMIIKLSIVFIIVQTLKGRLVVPFIMGHTMKIHPLTDIFLVIGAVALGGPIAAFIIVPLYSILKALVKNIYEYKITKPIE